MLKTNGSLEDTDYDANIKRRDVFGLNKFMKYKRALGSFQAAQYTEIQLMNNRRG
jgi:hypothetical protein